MTTSTNAASMTTADSGRRSCRSAASAEGVSLLALTIDERAIILAALEDPPDGLAELRAVKAGLRERAHEFQRR